MNGVLRVAAAALFVMPQLAASQGVEAPARLLAPSLVSGTLFPLNTVIGDGVTPVLAPTTRSLGGAAGRGALVGGGIGLAIGLVGFAVAANADVVFDPIALTVGYTTMGLVAGTGIGILRHIIP